MFVKYAASNHEYFRLERGGIQEIIADSHFTSFQTTPSKNLYSQREPELKLSDLGRCFFCVRC